MREVDRLMIEQYGIDLIRMMENAGRNLAVLARDRFLAGDASGKRVLVMAGTGGNGGGALVAARRLHIWGAEVRVVLSKNPTDLKPVPLAQHQILRQMGVPVVTAEFVPQTYDLVLDGLIGYSLNGSPRTGVARLITAANQLDAPILSLDGPSGLNFDSGEAQDPTIQAVATLTLALPKQGFEAATAKEKIGELYLGDISVPNVLYTQKSLGLEVPSLFNQSDVVRILRD